jgi:hypothetical protein
MWQQWRSIETAPKDGTDVLLFFPHRDPTVQVQIGSYDVGERIQNGKMISRFEGWNVGAFSWPSLRPGTKDANEDPTHWMPLPEPPQNSFRESGDDRT